MLLILFLILILNKGLTLKIFLVFIIFSLSFSQIAYSEQILRWKLLPLHNDDYIQQESSNSCKLFSDVIKNAKAEWPHVTPFKFSKETLKYFLLGYNTKEPLEADIVTVWPEYRERISKWYVLIGNNNCFVKWFNILPNELQDIIDIGFKKSL